jgi:hypothetical protein
MRRLKKNRASVRAEKARVQKSSKLFWENFLIGMNASDLVADARFEPRRWRRDGVARAWRMTGDHIRKAMRAVEKELAS